MGSANVVISLIGMLLYSLIVLVYGFWGNSILPITCDNKKLKVAIRALLATGTIGVTSCGAYLMCFSNCDINERPDTVSGMFLTFILLLHLLNISFMGIVYTEIGGDKCTNNSMKTYKDSIFWLWIFNMLIVLLLFGYTWTRIKKWSQEKVDPVIRARESKKQQLKQQRQKQAKESQEKTQRSKLEQEESQAKELEKQVDEKRREKESQQKLESIQQRKERSKRELESLNKPEVKKPSSSLYTSRDDLFGSSFMPRRNNPFSSINRDSNLNLPSMDDEFIPLFSKKNEPIDSSSSSSSVNTVIQPKKIDREDVKNEDIIQVKKQTVNQGKNQSGNQVKKQPVIQVKNPVQVKTQTKIQSQRRSKPPVMSARGRNRQVKNITSSPRNLKRK